MASNSGQAWREHAGEAALLVSGLDPLMVKYNESIYFDQVLHAQDIAGSIAFARTNTKGGILTPAEFQKIESGLRAVEEEWVSGTFKIIPGVDEDIHTANERRLGEIIGKDVAGKLHTGRSRNEQIATNMRMWLRDELRSIEGYLRAQPTRWSHWMLSYGLAFASDLERLREVIKRVNRSPLGCGALAGNPFGIDREMMAEELGFDGLLWNSMGGVADRDFVAETLQWGSMLMQHISRWAADLIIYSSGEFGFVRLADAYSTGSSLMPQKKNPDSLGLDRGGHYLVRKGVPFRETHHISGRCVALSEQTGTPMNELSYEQLKGVDARFGEDIAEVFNYEKSVEMRSAKGGTSKAKVLEQIKVLYAVLAWFSYDFISAG
ncbi:Argininosuccinate lyase [Pleurostoma richardsiae]|uniref:argininosuccinate lyase n=1 Tax=Pleurostoma richardsiae TaxID=41990 RepID=A0AA38R3V7_9PEZI|nr:Argininosuccinate lyase [Pleurostoma richardsiae]